MTLRTPLALTAVALLTVLLFSGLVANPVAAHTMPEPSAYAETGGFVPAQIDSPTSINDDDGSGWILFAAAVFIIFIVIGIVLSVFGYLEATRRE